MNRDWNSIKYTPEEERVQYEIKDYYKIPDSNTARSISKYFQAMPTNNPFVNSHFYKKQFKGQRTGKKLNVRKQEDFLVEGDFPGNSDEQ